MSVSIVFNPFTQTFDFVGMTGSPGGSPIEFIQGNTGAPVGPNGAFTVNLIGSGNIAVDGNAGTNTLTISENQAVLLNNYTNVNAAMSPYTVLPTDYYISIDASAGNVTILFPNAPTQYRSWVVKDRLGFAEVNLITLTTPGGTATFDGVTSYLLLETFEGDTLIFNGTTFEVY